MPASGPTQGRPLHSSSKPPSQNPPPIPHNAPSIPTLPLHGAGLLPPATAPGPTATAPAYPPTTAPALLLAPPFPFPLPPQPFDGPFPFDPQLLPPQPSLDFAPFGFPHDASQFNPFALPYAYAAYPVAIPVHLPSAPLPHPHALLMTHPSGGGPGRSPPRYPLSAYNTAPSHPARDTSTSPSPPPSAQHPPRPPPQQQAPPYPPQTPPQPHPPTLHSHLHRLDPTLSYPPPIPPTPDTPPRAGPSQSPSVSPTSSRQDQSDPHPGSGERPSGETHEDDNELSGLQRLARSGSRVSLACIACRQRKIKCNGAKPVCDNCTRRGAICVWDMAPRRRGPDKKPGGRVRKKELAAQAAAAMGGEPPQKLRRLDAPGPGGLPVMAGQFPHYGPAPPYGMLPPLYGGPPGAFYPGPAPPPGAQHVFQTQGGWGGAPPFGVPPRGGSPSGGRGRGRGERELRPRDSPASGSAAGAARERAQERRAARQQVDTPEEEDHSPEEEHSREERDRDRDRERPPNSQASQERGETQVDGAPPSPKAREGPEPGGKAT